jgi:ABC-2 type transport system permease protein
MTAAMLSAERCPFSALGGLWSMVRLVARRERVALAAWALVIAALTAMFASMSVNSLPTHDEAVQQSSLIASSPALRMFGPTFGATVGGYAVARSLLTLVVLVALASSFTVVRTTRRDEDDGRAELIGSAAVGRQARLVASLLVVGAFDLVVGLLVVPALACQGLPANGALLTGGAVAATGLVFAGIGALTAQLASGSRGANGLAGLALGLAFLASAAGSMLGTTTSDGTGVLPVWPMWLSPLGWAQQVRPFDEPRAWPLGLCAAAFVVLAAGAWWVSAHRDFGLGVVPERRGRAGAARTLKGPFGLVWRVERTGALSWALAMLGTGVAFGSLAAGGLQMSGSSAEWYARVAGSADMVPAFRTAMVQMAAVAAAVYAVLTVLRGRSDEVTGRSEPLHAATVSRLRWAAVHAAHALVGATALLALFGLGMALASGGDTGHRLAQVGPLVGAALAQLPAVLVVGGIDALAAGLLPRFAPAVAWPVLAASVLLGPTFGASLGVPAWVIGLSPLSHAPKAPAAAVAGAPLLALAAVAVGLVVLGALGAMRRDLRLPA